MKKNPRTKSGREGREPFVGQLGIRLEWEDYRMLQLEAERLKVSVSEYVRIWVRSLRPTSVLHRKKEMLHCFTKAFKSAKIADLCVTKNV